MGRPEVSVEHSRSGPVRLLHAKRPQHGGQAGAATVPANRVGAGLAGFQPSAAALIRSKRKRPRRSSRPGPLPAGLALGANERAGRRKLAATERFHP